MSHHDPAPKRDGGPDRLDQPKRPSPLKKAVGRPESGRRATSLAISLPTGGRRIAAGRRGADGALRPGEQGSRPGRARYSALPGVGGIIGLVSGLTGVGGSIFLAPLVLSLGWATTRQTAAISVVFNLLNSAAALAGTWATLPLLPTRLPVWLVCVGFGGLFGSWMGALHLNPRTLRLLLALLLLAAAGRMITVSF